MDVLELQKRILRYLFEMEEEERPLESLELADKWAVGREDVVKACSGLVRQGLVERESYRSSDNNIVLRQLTLEGKQFVKNEWRRSK